MFLLIWNNSYKVTQTPNTLSVSVKETCHKQTMKDLRIVID